MHSLFSWIGGKSQDIKHIKPYFPKTINAYIEPFIGGGSVFFNLNHSQNIVNDNDADLINLYRHLANPDNEIFFKEKCQTYNNLSAIDRHKVFTYIIYILNNNYPYNIDRAILFYIYKKMVYRGMMRYNRFGKYANYKINITNGKLGKLKLRLSAIFYQLMKDTTIYNTDYKEIFDMGKMGDFVFIDPPYSTTMGYQTKFTKNDHIELADKFKSSIANVMLVVNDIPLMRQLYDGYIVGRYEKTYAVKPKTKEYILIINNYI